MDDLILLGETSKNVTVDFHGQELLILEKEGIPCVAMKPIVDGIGLNWGTQYRKITETARYCHMTIPLKTAGGVQEMLCIPMKKLNGWLFSINPEKVKYEIKKIVELYQEECFIALYDYWHKGTAVNPRFLKQEASLVSIVNEYKVALEIAHASGFSGNQAVLSTNRMVKALYGIDCLEMLGNQALISEEQEPDYNATTLGNLFLDGISGRNVNQLLSKAGLIYSYRDNKNKLTWDATADGMPYIIWKDTGKKHSNGTPVKQLCYLQSFL